MLKVSENVNRLIQKINTDTAVISVSVTPAPTATQFNCYGNVAKQVEQYGGMIIYGWLLVENIYLCEAVHHAIWKDAAGKLIDVTPNGLRYEQISFLPDDRFVYQGQHIDNIRLNTTDNLMVDDLIVVASADSTIKGWGVRLDDYCIHLKPEHKALVEKYYLLGQILAVQLSNDANHYSDCFCGSGKNYANCHRLVLHSELAADGLV